MGAWVFYAVGAAILYGMHQIFTKLAADGIGDGVGGFIVEASASITILGYLLILWLSDEWKQPVTTPGVVYSLLTGLCVGIGTVMFFLLFQKGGPLSAVPAILAVGAAIMAVVGIVLFKEAATASRLLGIVLSLLGLFLLRQ